MKDNYRQHEYKVAQQLPTRTRERIRKPTSHEYQRSRPYGRDTSGYNAPQHGHDTSGYDALQRLKEIAEYVEPPRSQPIKIFDPSTMLNEHNGRKLFTILTFV